ncbi:MAG: hypothetical protein IPF92_15490 [Myxococcales bacterium]|nr:hypothetical protein [Myxococcales bacterium]
MKHRLREVPDLLRDAQAHAVRREAPHVLEAVELHQARDAVWMQERGGARELRALADSRRTADQERRAIGQDPVSDFVTRRARALDVVRVAGTERDVGSQGLPVDGRHA